jgi:hypothetical protein
VRHRIIYSRSAALRAGLRRKERFFFFLPGIYASARVARLGAMPGYCQPSLAGLVRLRVQRLHLAESGKAVPGPDGGGVSIHLGASFVSRQPGSGTSAAEAGFSIGFTAGMNACSTPRMLTTLLQDEGSGMAEAFSVTTCGLCIVQVFSSFVLGWFLF